MYSQTVVYQWRSAV